MVEAKEYAASLVLYEAARPGKGAAGTPVAVGSSLPLAVIWAERAAIPSRVAKLHTSH